MLRKFSIGITLRITGTLALSLALAWAWVEGHHLLATLFFGLLIWSGAVLYRYVTGLNRKLARFFDAVQYSDFASTFRADNQLGRSFEDVNQRFNSVLEEFRQARAEKEANLQYLQTIVQHVNVGIIVCNTEGKVELVNQAALRLLGIYRLRNLTDLEKQMPQLAALLRDPHRRAPRLFNRADGQQITSQAAVIRLRGRLLHLASFQNIRSELQQKEIEAWQNLTRVLRHEIMNSVTPLVTLIGTMKDIVEEDLNRPEKLPEAITDLQSALDIVEGRGRGIMRFVEAYRSFSNLPQPRIVSIPLANWLERVGALLEPELSAKGIVLQCDCADTELLLNADPDQLEMVLLNLVKNAAEALQQTMHPCIDIRAYATAAQHVVLEVADNGPGIPEEHQDQIFVPFFTTKPSGNGVGLSISRQIMQLHGGDIRRASAQGEGARFVLEF